MAAKKQFLRKGRYPGLKLIGNRFDGVMNPNLRLLVQRRRSGETVEPLSGFTAAFQAVVLEILLTLMQ